LISPVAPWRWMSLHQRRDHRLGRLGVLGGRAALSARRGVRRVVEVLAALELLAVVKSHAETPRKRR
jgi:hypothetical protein